MKTFITIQDVSFFYGERQALKQVSLSAPTGALVALLGPNGSGKTTLFRVLSGLQAPGEGSARVLGMETRSERQALRGELGVVFQSPSLDDKLTVVENLRHHGRLYGWWGRALRQRIDEQLARFSLQERGRDRVGTLSGGLKRQVELARALLHQPPALFLDEPTTGLDPSARAVFWRQLERIRAEQELSVLYTTHWFEEAEQAEQVAILDHGVLVADGAPDRLTTELGKEIVTLQTKEPAAIADYLRETHGLTPTIREDEVRFSIDADGPALIARIMEARGDAISMLAAGKPTLADVYVARTGHTMAAGAES